MVYFSDLLKWFISRKTIIFQVSRGGGGGESNIFLLWGSHYFLCKPIKLVIFREGRTSCPSPLDPRMQSVVERKQRGILVKILISLELHHIFRSKFVYLYTFFKLSGKINKFEKLLSIPGIESLCIRLLDYKT